MSVCTKQKTSLLLIALCSTLSPAFAQDEVKELNGRQISGPPITNWKYEPHADTVTGAFAPGAYAMTAKLSILSPSRPDFMTVAHIAVWKEADDSLAAGFALSTNPMARKDGACDPVACRLTIKFGAAPPATYIAARDRYSEELYVLKDARPFWASAAKNGGPVTVQYVDVNKVNQSFEYTIQKPLQLEKLKR